MIPYNNNDFDNSLKINERTINLNETEPLVILLV